MKKVRTEWEKSTYDVWGNATDGYDVNDTYRHGPIVLTIKAEVMNQGTPHEFHVARPTDAQIRKIFGVRCRIETDGDDVDIRVDRERDGFPIGELNCTSHSRLSWKPGEDGPPRAND